MPYAASPQTKPSALSAGLMNASVLLYTLWLLLPALQTTGGAAAGVFCIALFALGVALDSAYLQCRWVDFLFRALSAAALPLIFWFFLRRGGSNFWGYYVQQGMFWFPLLYCAYAKNRQDPRLWRFLFATVGICMVITTLTTTGWLIEGILRGDRIYAYSRSLGSGEPNREVYLKELMLRNIGGYDFVYATALSLPVTCYLMRRCQGVKRAGLLVFALIQLGMVALSQYTYALIFAAGILALEGMATFFRFLSQKLWKRSLGMEVSLLWGLLPFVLLFLLRIPLLSWAVSFCEGTGFANLAYSLRQLLILLTEGAADAASRLDYYRLPLAGIQTSPLIGSLAGAPFLLSQHSDMLDLLSGMGILGGLLVCVLIAHIGRGLFRKISVFTRPHLILQWIVFLGCTLFGTVLYSRDISLILCISALLSSCEET